MERTLRRLFVLVCSLAAFVGCSGIGHQENFAYREIPTDNFTIAAWQKIGSSTDPSYVVYIEGDGNAFNSFGYPTLNPTIKNSKLKKMAFRSGVDRVAYVGRACQFVTDKGCNQLYWTSARFSRAVVDSMALAIKNIVGDSEVTLIGYSGGAQIAGLIAVGNYGINVMKLITIAGNLDHKSWTKHHNISELSESLDLSDYRDKYLKIPQIHYVGEKDRVIPNFLTEEFVKNDELIVKIPRVGHVNILDVLSF